MKSWIWILLGLLALPAALALAGSLLPRQHLAVRATFIPRPADEVSGLVRDITKTPVWRKDVRLSAWLPEEEGRRRFREEGSQGAVTYRVEIDGPGRRWSACIADLDLGYGGSWTYEFEPRSGGTWVRLTERGEVPNPIFRFLSRFVFTHHRHIEQALRALGAHFGQNPIIVEDPHGT
jgi:hypothetical protein